MKFNIERVLFLVMFFVVLSTFFLLVFVSFKPVEPVFVDRIMTPVVQVEEVVEEVAEATPTATPVSTATPSSED